MFAVVQEYGERVDMHVAAWGLAYDDGADVFDTNGNVHRGLNKPEDALPWYCFGSHVTAHLVWVDPAAATSDEPEPS